LAIFNSVLSLPADKNNKPSGITPPPKKDFDINKAIDHASSPASGSHSSGSHHSSSSQGASQSQPSGSTNSKSRSSPVTKQRISNYAQHKKAREMGYDEPPKND